jgi:ABC-2 type transport system ATP-binding protein
VDKSELHSYKGSYNLISTQLKEGKLSLRIVSEQDPENGFAKAPTNLEDVYFSHIAQKMDPITL